MKPRAPKPTPGQELRDAATAAARRITGKRWCQYGRHEVPVESLARTRPRPQCTTCAARVAAATRRPITPALPPVLGERYRDVLTDRYRAACDDEEDQP